MWKFKVSGQCSIFVEGIDMNCPLCGSLVKSGEQHACRKLEKQPEEKAAKPRREKRVH